MIIAIKYNDDQHYSNELYSSIGGMECDELNELDVLQNARPILFSLFAQSTVTKT